MPRSSPRLFNRAFGFTLLEIMVVVVIIGILAAIAAINVFPNVGIAERTAAKAEIKTIAGALDMYRLDNFTYPSTEQGLSALVQKPGGQPEAPNWRQGGYLSTGLPKDPWQRPYLYLHPGQQGEVDVYSLGADGKPGGEGNNADIGSWQKE